MAQPDLDAVPIPDVQLRRIRVDADSLRLIRFEDPDAGDISHVVASTSAPQLSRVQIVEPDPYARRAGLSIGRPATVFLILEILSDGSVGAISVSRSSGSAAADAAAAEYARQLRWTPGTMDHRAQTMRITFPITLAVRTDRAT
jgi:TonB family protein